MNVLRLFRHQQSTVDTWKNFCVEQSRRPDFYEKHNVPDTLDGRFDMMVLMVSLLTLRLNNAQDKKRASRLSHQVFTSIFKDMEQSLRQIGVGDLSVPKKMRFMLKAFNGRCHRYETCLMPEVNESELLNALKDNLFRRQEDYTTEDIMRTGCHRDVIALWTYLLSLDDQQIFEGDLKDAC